MSERLSREELDKISARAKTAREALMWLIRNYGDAMARRQYHQVEAPMNDVPALLGHIAALEAENERLRSTLAAKETVQRANEDEMSAENERLRDVVDAAMVMLDRMYPELYQTPPHLRPLISALLRAERERERERE